MQIPSRLLICHLALNKVIASASFATTAYCAEVWRILPPSLQLQRPHGHQCQSPYVNCIMHMTMVDTDWSAASHQLSKLSFEKGFTHLKKVSVGAMRCWWAGANVDLPIQILAHPDYLTPELACLNGQSHCHLSWSLWANRCKYHLIMLLMHDSR